MKMLSRFMPDSLLVLFKRLGIALLMLFITRIIFYISNIHSFEEMGIKFWFLGIWFDIITIALLFLPFYTLHLLPFGFTRNKWYQRFLKLLFHCTNILLIAANLVDVEYFKYTSKRSTFDLFSMVSTGNDFNQLIGSFISDFWFHFVILFILVLLSEWLYRKTASAGKVDTHKYSMLSSAVQFFIALPVLFFIGRGGFGLKPIGIIEAANYTEGQFTSFVLPTPFTMIKTIDQKGLEEKSYFSSDQKLNALFTPIKKTVPQNILPDNANVVIILLESFGTEFIGFYNDSVSYTPFLDSLLNQSLAFEYAFANGKKSIEAVPAVLASMPTLMDNPYISSPYGDNKIQGLPTILKQFGYSSGFYHGATNGSMSFDGFAKLCGFEKYVGRTEYNNENHSDHKWGILDEYFNPWTAREMSKLKQPFIGTLFTLSSHHPYYIPDHMKDKVKQGPQQICASINYADMALKMFFDEAKKQPWYDNTLFVILADHTPASSTPFYSQRTQMYKIPLAFYHPSGKLKPQRSKKIIQQMDILPTVLDLLNINTSYYAFGNSHFSAQKGEAVNYLQGTYQYYYDDQMMIFSNDRSQSLVNYKVHLNNPPDSLKYYVEQNKPAENRMKAIIQTYNRDLINNRTHIE